MLINFLLIHTAGYKTLVVKDLMYCCESWMRFMIMKGQVKQIAKWSTRSYDAWRLSWITR